MLQASWTRDQVRRRSTSALEGTRREDQGAYASPFVNYMHIDNFSKRNLIAPLPKQRCLGLVNLIIFS